MPIKTPQRSFLIQKGLLPTGKFLLLAFLFGTNYTQSPLYSSNQVQYFLQGMARGGYGFLKNDWMANSVDPAPAFSFVVFFTYRFLFEFFFYLYWFFLAGIYIYSICGIAALIFKINSSRAKFLAFLALVFAFHSPLVDYIGSNWFGMTQQHLLNRGVAGQYLLGYVFQPSLFGVFFVLSIYLFLRWKTPGAILSLAIAATFHTSSMLSAAILTVAYMALAYQEKREFKKPFLIGFSALLLVLPAVVYLFINFGPGSSEHLRQSQEILANFRIPHHVLSKRTEMGEWFYLRILVVIIAMFLVRRTRLFGVFGISFSIVALLSFIQILTDSNSLGLIFPWRLSTVLVPLSLSMIVAWLIDLVFEKAKGLLGGKERLINAVSLGAILLLLLWGTREMKLRYQAHYHNRDAPMMEFVKQTKLRGDTYLIPSLHLEELENFRLYTGAPIFIDLKAVPYHADDVLEWYERNMMAEYFYEAPEMDCRFLKELAAEYGITHLVLENRCFPATCPELEQIYRDDFYGVYKISR